MIVVSDTTAISCLLKLEKLHLGIPTIGLVGVLLTLKQNRLLPAVKPVLDELRNHAGFYLSDVFYAKILAGAGE